MDYHSSGVSIDAGNEAVRRIKSLARGTFTPGVLSEIGSFGGLFSLAGVGLREPVLVASADGVGTKLKVAFRANRHDTVGADLVNHCVNDILVQGAEPLFFLDYLATGRLAPDVAESIVSGMANACRENSCALLGGETHVAELARTGGAALLEPHRSYLPFIQPLLEAGRIKGMAHITGGGITDNLPRILPHGTAAVVDLSSWKVPALFRWLQMAGEVPVDDMLRTFNMGIGLIVVTAAN